MKYNVFQCTVFPHAGLTVFLAHGGILLLSYLALISSPKEMKKWFGKKIKIKYRQYTKGGKK